MNPRDSSSTLPQRRGHPLVRRLPALAARLGLAVLLMLAMAWLWQQLLHAPARQSLASIDLRLSAGQVVVLGRRELVAPAAAERHVQVSRDDMGRWGMRNISAQHAAELTTAGTDQLLRTWLLQAGQQLQLGTERWRVDTDANALVLTALTSGRQWRYDGATVQALQADAAMALPTCRDARKATRWRQRWNNVVPRWLAWGTRMTLGGQAECSNQVPAAGLPADNLWLQRQHGHYLLTASAQAARQICIQGTGAVGTLSLEARSVDCRVGGNLFEQQMPLESASRMVIGRTHYALALKGDDLTMTPVVRAGLMPLDASPPRVDVMGAAIPLPSSVATVGAMPNLQWQTRTLDPFRWPASVPVWLPGLLALLCLATAAWFALRHRLASHVGTALALGLGLCGLLMSAWAFKLGGAMGAAWSLSWVGLALAAVVILPVRTGWAWAAQAGMAVLLLGGLALQMQLGLQGQDTQSWLHFQKTCAAGAGAIWLSFAAAALVGGQAQSGPRLHLPALATLDAWVVLVPSTLALALLAMQVLFGAEEGVWGIQPVEFAMLALLLLGAHVLSLRQDWGASGWRQWHLWWHVAQPLGVFMAIVALALLLLNDYSPLLLMGGWALGMVAAWCVAGRSPLAGLLLALGLGATAALYQWVAGDGNLWLQEHGFYGARFAVWLDALHHPHSGEQVTRALQVLGRGQWWGDVNAPAWRVPAVQDDMAPAFFTGRFGLAWALALMAAQAAYVVALLMLGWHAHRAAGPGDHRRRWGLNLVFFAAWGAATLFASHLVLSWGTNTGGLPVMGQPMPLLSSGSSVIWMLLAPLQALWMLQPALIRGAATPRNGQYPRQT